jgi:uncharacterized surface protein with fasciclin (FAS1) repeats
MRGTAVRWLGLLALGLLPQGAAAGGPQKDIVTTAAQAGKFKTLAAALKQAGLVGTLQGKGPFTVFAPTDEAFARLPEGALARLLLPQNKHALVRLLTYHVAGGRRDAAHLSRTRRVATLNGQAVRPAHRGRALFVNASRVVTADIACSNGVIHVIDRVLMPATDDLLETAAGAGKFKTLAAAVKAAMLAEALKGEGPFTLFAPTDEAFRKLPRHTLESLLKPENRPALARILKYHVVKGRKDSAAVLASRSLTTLEGSRLHVNPGPAVNQSRLIETDIDASNGIIHVIDRVLTPPEKKDSPAEFKQMIESAVRRGATLYNAGDERGCAAHYQTTVRHMMSLSPEGMPKAARDRLESGMREAGRHAHDADRQAWALRHTLDDVYRMMTTQPGQHP